MGKYFFLKKRGLFKKRYIFKESIFLRKGKDTFFMEKYSFFKEKLSFCKENIHLKKLLFIKKFTDD